MSDNTRPQSFLDYWNNPYRPRPDTTGPHDQEVAFSAWQAGRAKQLNLDMCQMPNSTEWLDTPEVKDALSRMIYTTCPIAHMYRELGKGPATKVEDEQAFVMIKFLKMIREYGDEWKVMLGRELAEMAAEIKIKRAKAKLATETATPATSD